MKEGQIFHNVQQRLLDLDRDGRYGGGGQTSKETQTQRFLKEERIVHLTERDGGVHLVGNKRM